MSISVTNATQRCVIYNKCKTEANAVSSIADPTDQRDLLSLKGCILAEYCDPKDLKKCMSSDFNRLSVTDLTKQLLT